MSSVVAAIPAAPALPTESVLTQVGGTLGGILLLILALAWLVKRLGFAARPRGERLLNVRASCSLGQRERLVVVEVDNQCLVLGVTAQSITHLHTFDVPATTEHDAAGRPTSFQHLLRQAARHRFGRSKENS
ncbi:flagellar biosynthetic protein FliO [Edwardsiella piscicida]|uniref:Flagellar protein n=3 Tax=Edwardsiella TaxID=635 RepID=A0A0H3DVS2_EDWTF|nr:flagellar biosynthetic protein FliO [Edwardsiella piscicida]ACY84986.1 flagellar biogenesis protein [Edwardsiella tarda EIB202]ADM42049.1 Flagellar biosynthesis protein FliO [Edwardsiella tarda FL6-60]AGH74161.1 Flagellar biosynthesis protein FliO [Edwardsiella piscicida C07-087]AOP43383.1 flagellar biosynthetic protein FliO [Edwardsiella piscicida]ARD19571.1 flagellar biosynthetic protein FliO [Edwardsiella piscicida]